MKRTNIYLTEDEHRILRERADTSSTSMAQVIRGILDRELGLAPGDSALTGALAASAGIWSYRTEEELQEMQSFRAGDRFMDGTD